MPASGRTRTEVLPPTSLLTFFAALLLLLVPVRASAQALSMEEAMREALRNHERAKIAELSVEAAEGNVAAARSDFLPTLALGAEAVLAPPDEQDRYVTGAGTLTLRQPLLNPSAIPRLSSAEHDLEAEKLISGEELRGLAFETAQAFLVALAADRFVEAAEARVKRAKANQDNAQARVDAELNSSNDVTRAKLESAAAAREVAERKRDAIRARLALELLVGHSVGALISPETMIENARTYAGDTAKLAAVAATTRPDVLALAERSEAARELANEPLYRLIPSLDLTGQLRVNPDPLPNRDWHDESLTLSLSWIIFDGGQRYADRKSLLARALIVETEQSLVTRTLPTQVKSAMTGLEAAQQTYAIAQETTAAAKTNTEETQVLYQEGLARAIELVDANAEQFDAEIEAAASRIEMARSFLELRSALGLQPVEGFRGTK